MTVGIVHPGVPQQLALFLKAALGLDVLIETGTYLGHVIAHRGGEKLALRLGI